MENWERVFSQWMSQAALFCIMRTCLESSIARIPYIRIENAMSRSYKRGVYIRQMKKNNQKQLCD